MEQIYEVWGSEFTTIDSSQRTLEALSKDSFDILEQQRFYSGTTKSFGCFVVPPNRKNARHFWGTKNSTARILRVSQPTLFTEELSWLTIPRHLLFYFGEEELR